VKRQHAVPDRHVINGGGRKAPTVAAPRADGQGGGPIIVQNAAHASAFEEAVHVQLAVRFREGHEYVPPEIVRNGPGAGDCAAVLAPLHGGGVGVCVVQPDDVI